MPSRTAEDASAVKRGVSASGCLDPAALCTSPLAPRGETMQLTRLAIRNFRNLRDVDIPLQPGTVIVGENRSGKSNLLHAVRLVLDASVPNSDRHLTPEDFSEALSDDGRDP